jgi:type II secretory pathway pseudopilin PulG
MRHASNSSRGYSLLELLISAAIGMILVGAATQVYSRGLKAAWVTSQKAELQQDFRSASNLLQRDISMAGAGALGQQGMSTSAIGLPVSGTRPVYPCTGLVTCNYIAGAPVAYPLSGGVPYIYSIVPGPNLGITINAGQGPTDIITVNYADAGLPLNCYVGSMNAAGTLVTFQLPSPLPGTCVLPPNLVAPQPLNAAVVGLQAGDMIEFGTKAMGVVTGAVGLCAPTPPAAYSACYTVPFAATDPGHVNQPAAASGSLFQFASAATPSAVRLISVTYYLDISPSDGVTPRLMRLQSGQIPAPVAENVVYLKFTYDVYNAGVVQANQATLPAGTTPSMITKVNIAHMSMRSQQNTYNGYQGLDLQTSISARNLTSQQEYPISGSAY